MKNDLLLIAMQEMYTEIKAKRREWEKQGGREDQIDRRNYLDGFSMRVQLQIECITKVPKTPNNSFNKMSKENGSVKCTA